MSQQRQMQSGEPGAVLILFQTQNGIAWVSSDANGPGNMSGLESIRIFPCKPQVRDFYLRVDGTEARLPNFAGGSDRSLFLKGRDFQLHEKGVIEVIIEYKDETPQQSYLYYYVN